MARLERAWWEPRMPSLALPAETKVTLLGRSSECDCVLSDQTVSRQHAALRQDGGAWFLRDLRSTNGTLVNGMRVLDEVQVRPGDRVTFGAVVYRLGPPQVALRRRSSSEVTSAGEPAS
jgi:pSer/pThr/pTyr-binding forkhead associated (FHA) protein